jgi:hypothetical protein
MIESESVVRRQTVPRFSDQAVWPAPGSGQLRFQVEFEPADLGALQSPARHAGVPKLAPDKVVELELGLARAVQSTPRARSRAIVSPSSITASA